MNHSRFVRGGIALIALGVLALLPGCARRQAAAETVPTEAVARQDLTVSVEATGTVEPINLVDVKSKASGQILQMPVEVGSVVRQGDLLVQIDTHDVQNQYDQARAALEAARAKVEVSGAQKQRADDLFGQQVITAPEHEAAVLDIANARSALVQAETNLELAKQRLDDATVRAPQPGTVLSKPVSVGTVISSATSSVGGGTTLLQMADLRQIRMRALVSETDIGQIHAGQQATVTVDAYPNRPFTGTVEKIEPQSVVQQSVTMFPVLVSLANEDGLLLPGMNGEITVLVERRTDVLAVPVDALRSMRELATVAPALGLDPDSVRAQIRAQLESRRAARERGAAAATPGDSASAHHAGGMRGGGGGRWRGGAGMEGTGGVAGGDGGRGRRWRGGAGTAGAGGAAGGAGGAGGGADAPGAATQAQAQIAFVHSGAGFVPRLVRVGVSNYDYSEVIAGLEEGEQVALLSVSQLQQQRKEDLSRIRQRVGGAVPGVGGGSGAAGGARTGGGGGR